MMNPPFLSYNNYLRKKFGCPVYKVSVDAGFSCPNRDGTKGRQGCIFCDEVGSSARASCRHGSITQQVLNNGLLRRKRSSACKFIAYFQSFTNTYAPIERLRAYYDEAVNAHPDIVGLSISTRPDSVDEQKLALIAEYREKLPYVCVEYGVQSVHDRTLARINRQETHQDFVGALALSQRLGLETCAHVILGLPGESVDDQLATADRLAELGVGGVKIHMLVAMENTTIAEQYRRGEWSPLEFEDFVDLATAFIKRLPPECVIHRIGGNGHPHFVVAPNWVIGQRNNIIEAVTAKLSV
ncbi:MAG: TIGR01212 family radical SAM protein [Chlamydiota bacterium]